MNQFKKNMEFNLAVENSSVGMEHLEEVNYFNPNAPLPALQQVEHLLVEEALRRSEGNQSIACKLLGISQPALSKRVKKMRQTSED